MAWLDRLRPREGWLSVLLIGVMVWAVTHSVEEAGWVEHLDVLVPLGLAGVVVGLIATRSALRSWAGIGCGLALGVEAIVIVYANRLTGATWEQRLTELGTKVGVWVETAVTGGNSRENLIFAMVMAALAWSLGYVSSWLVYRRGTAWAVVVLNAVALLLHLSYSYSSLNYHFYIQLFAGFLLLVRIELSRREMFWRGAHLAVQGHVRRNVVLTSAAAIFLVMKLATLGPAEQPSDLLEPAWARFVDTWQRGQSNFDRLFGGVQGPPVVVVGLAFGNTMQPREGFELGTEPVLKIVAPRSRYWRTATYDVYTGQGMLGGEVYGDRFEADQPIPVPFGATEAREEMEQTVTVLAPQSNLVFAADAPVRVSVPTLFEWRNGQDDLAALRLTQMIRRGQQYTVWSMASVATESQLRTAGTQYPAGIERYLQLPAQLPPRVRQFSLEITAGASTPFDQAILVERYLRQLPYETRVAPPPADRDWVDYTLFDAQGGYSDYFTTSMVVMLRSLGVPARAVSGFAPGQLDEEEGAFILYESDAHSWVEVFFPRYGWINFEPSAIRALPFRPTDEVMIEIDPETAAAMLGDGSDLFIDDPFFDMGDYVPPLPPRRDEAWLIALGYVGALGVLGGTGYWAVLAAFRRGIRGLPWHAQWYAQFRRLAAWGGLAGHPSQTPYEYARWLDQRFPGTEQLVVPIADCYVEGAYGGREPGPEHLARAAEAWEQVRRPLARRVVLRGIIAVRDAAHQVRERARERVARLQ